MADRITLSAPALSTFSAYLPEDLTEDQADKLIRAAEQMAGVIWQEATAAQIARSAIRTEFRQNDKRRAAEVTQVVESVDGEL